MSDGKSIRLFLAEGSMGGLVTAEIMNWTGHVLVAQRSGLGELLKREEASRTGVYLLLGDDPDSLGGQKVYVGEGDDVSSRLRQHESGKDFWERVVVLTNKDANLTKAHGRYLEARLIEMAHAAKRSELTNGTVGTKAVETRLPEADRSDMEHYLAQAQIVLPALGVNIFRSAAARDPQTPEAPPSVKFVAGLGGESWATAQEIDGEFTVLEGSKARPWSGPTRAYKDLQVKLLTDGTLIPDADAKFHTFTHDQVFNSVSAASSVIHGRNSNGRNEWRVEGSKQTFADWQEAQTKVT